MATPTNQSRCGTCGKGKATSRCVGCLQDFCLTHFIEHRQQLSRQLDQIEQDRDLFQQTINEQKINPQNNLLVQQVDQWERDSIEKIQQTAREIRELLSNHVNENIIGSKKKLDQLTQQIKSSREDDDIMESDLQKWKEELQQITQQLNKPSNITIEQTEIPVVNKIRVQLSGKYTHSTLLLNELQYFSLKIIYSQNLLQSYRNDVSVS